MEIFLRAAPSLSGEPLHLSIPHARNFVLCLKFIILPNKKSMESPINSFLTWLNSEKLNGYTETISFLFLSEFPGYGLQKVSSSNRRDYNELLKEFLLSINDPKEILGMSLCVQNMISFIVHDWDNIDDALDKARMFELTGSESEREIEALNDMKARHFKNIAPRKELKESWDKFTKEIFNYENFHIYSLSTLSKGFSK